MKRFAFTFLLYLSPLICYTLICEYYFFVDKETVGVDKVVQGQLKSKRETYYFRSFFNNSPSLYKLKMAQKKNADILIIGQSTVLQFRDVMFHPFESSFYNMGFSINNMNDLESLLHYIKTGKLHKPKLIILGLDVSLIKKTLYINPDNEILNPHCDEVSYPKYHAMASQLFIKAQLSKKTVDGLPNRHLGFGYLGERGTGFRRDGSMHYAGDIEKFIKDPVFRDPGNYKKLLDDKDYIFTEPYEIDQALLKRLLIDLKLLKQNGTEVTVFIPPISDDFYSYFATNKKFNAFFNDYLGIQSSLADDGIDVINFTTPKGIGLSDIYMLDGIHPGEVFTGRLLYEHIAKSKQKGLLSKVDTGYLKKLILSKTTIPLSFMRDTSVFSY
ncbi:hypothetical protein FPZ42_16210 [Mucilaginibacter achroorhodeus]|uniref:Uncharacterized protein n=1 Tax=Mucilaginibacter achroorhodeus TaxID=2599294 RepID=A0A563TZ57_9SPHI|nr:hypothetical protein [Mucilaginibacter achroorhodeus]TWR24637.1 hypothetical protein FPZ42_16210 [Mucilaginibacter achroorhodeus]